MTASLLTYWFGPPAAGEGASHSSAARVHTDAIIVRAIQQGDREAFDRLFRAYYGRLWVYARRRCASDDVANDVVQDVFIALWTSRATWSIRVSIKAYLFGAVQRRILHLRRHAAVVARVEAESVAAGTLLGLGAAPLAADAQTDVAERARLISHAVQTLPERQRTVLALWWRDEMTSPEIAEVLGVSPQAVRKLLAKAWSHLRDELSSELR